ncbi:integrase [Mariprofundus sp. EBB-1]|uniref:Mu transposase C-terminal domain-containing protein n=1 Tax=Mariprofundus sp. EBB-1 TaxID=2650971 RepID=UPI000EF23DA7|nr:Mu transposase C-terminal domain-containing protein [Mariprofundus sp. EBB-1]RLL49803.1 integrase [Mariprofundus sp. EBB-1]
MSRAYLQAKQVIIIDGTRHTILRSVAKDEWQIEVCLSGRIETKTTKELLSLLAADRLEFEVAIPALQKGKAEKLAVALDLIPEHLREEAKMRYAYMMATKKAELRSFTGKTLEPVIAETAKKLASDHKPPHWATVNRWRKKFVKSGEDIRSLVSCNSNKGRKAKYDSFVIDAVQQAVDAIYMSEERGSVQDTIEHATHLISIENKLRPAGDQLPLPTRYIVKKEISQLPEFDKAVARKGRQAALRDYRGVLGKNVSSKPLENAEIDHTVLDIIVVDEETMLPLGRPTLTICIDSMTRCILGLYIGFESPSHSTVAQCLKHCFLPKSNLKELYPKVRNDWECFGVMETLVVDNGLEFHGHSLDSLGESYGINIQYSPRKKPWFKPYIERVIGTLNKGLIHKVPGTTYSNIFEKGDYDALKKSTITLSTLHEITNIWIVDYYHQRIHRTLRQQPAKVWRDNIDQIPVPLPSSIRDLDALTGYIETRILSHKGIELDRLLYNSHELIGLREQLGCTLQVSIRYNVNDLGHIYVINPRTNDLIKVPSLNPEYTNGLTKFQHDICKKYSTQILERSEIEDLAEAKEIIRELISDDFGKKKVKTRKKAGRFKNDPSGKKPKNDDVPTTDKKVEEPTKTDIPKTEYVRGKLGTILENRSPLQTGEK